MTSIKALDKLREVVRCGQGHGFSSAKAYYKALDGCIAEIEREVSERFMELPVDADGVPIHMGDTVEGELLYGNATVKGTVTTYHIHGNDEPGTVYIKVKPTENTWTIKELRFTRCHHVNPRTIEDVLFGFLHEFGRESEWKGLEGRIGEYADEIRELMGVGE